MNRYQIFLITLGVEIAFSTKVFGQADTLSTVQDSIWKTLSIDEVTISAKFLKRKSDGYVVSLQNNPIAKGKDLRKVLGYLPGVNTTNGIMINHQAGTLIFIDNREVKDEKELEALQADQIDKVEIKYNAGVAFDARNSGGIIYITMKKNIDKGYYGSLSLSGTVRPKFGWSSDYVTLPLSFRIGKFSFYNYFWYSDFKSIFEYAYHNVYKTTHTSVDRTTKTKSWDRTLTEVFSTVYDINKNQYIGMYLEAGGTKGNPKVTSVASNSAIDAINRKSDAQKYQGTLDYKITFGEKKSTFNVKSDYLYQKENNSGHYYDLLETYGNDNLDKQIRMFRTEAKLNFNLSESTSLKFGGEYSRNRTETLQDSKFQREQYQNVDIDANIHADDYAGYISLASKLSKLNINAGVRYQADRVYHIVEGYEKQGKTFRNLYPSLNLSMPLNEKRGSRISVDLTKSLLYLPYSELSPVITMNDAYSYTKGNLDLAPTNEFCFSGTYSPNDNWNISYSFSKVTDDINYVTEVENAEKQLTYSMPINMGRSWSHSFSFDGKIDIANWLQFYPDAYWFFGKRHYLKDNINQEIKHNRLGYSMQFVFNFKHDFGGAISFNGESRSKLDDKIMHSVYNFSGYLYKRFYDNKLVLSLSASPFYSKRRSTDIDNQDYASHCRLKTSQTNFTLTLTYRFNSKKNVDVKSVDKLQNIETRTERK